MRESRCFEGVSWSLVWSRGNPRLHELIRAITGIRVHSYLWICQALFCTVKYSAFFKNRVYLGIKTQYSQKSGVWHVQAFFTAGGWTTLLSLTKLPVKFDLTTDLSGKGMKNMRPA